MAEVWMRMDHEHEGTRALEMLVEQLEGVVDDPYRWTWAIAALHNSLHAFMVAAVSGSDLLGAMTPEYAKHWQEQYEKGQNPTKEERLASFPELFKRVQSDGMRRFVDSRPLSPSADEKTSVGRLNKWRNDFVHYKPKSLSIEVSGFPQITRDCLKVIRFLAFETRNLFRLVDEWSDRTEAALSSAGSLLDQIEAVYDQAA